MERKELRKKVAVKQCPSYWLAAASDS